MHRKKHNKAYISPPTNATTMKTISHMKNTAINIQHTTLKHQT